jgi:hypothetical protein
MKPSTKPAPKVSKPGQQAVKPRAFSGSFVGQQAGYSVWCFDKGNWRMVENRSGKGFVPGDAPRGRGKFDGDCVKVTSVPAGRNGK